MAQRAARPAEVTRLVVNLSRALSAATRAWGFYPPEHPAVALALDRLTATLGDVTSGGPLELGVTPKTLIVEDVSVEAPDSVVECAAMLHDRDVLQLNIVSAPPEPSLRALLAILSLDRETRRTRGGPEKLWAAENDESILLRQIDYQEILEREDDGAARRDATWRAIVRSVIMGRKTFTADEQERLLEISRDVGAIGELTKDAREPFCTPEGSPLVTTQAAIVLAVYRHLAKTVGALEPDRAREVIDSIALAASALDPSTVFELLRQEESADDPVQIVAALKQTFDDQQVAMLLARALSTPGHPTGRLAQVLDTLAPDETRRTRVLKLAERLISERDFGSKRPIEDIRQSLDELLLKYDETTYVSSEYRASMDNAAVRAAELAARGLPPEMDEWLATLGHESVRRLSGQLLMDLLRNETSAERMGDTARDMGAFVEDLLLAGAFDEGVPVIETLADVATKPPALAPGACRAAIESVGISSAFAEAASTIGEQSAQEYAAFAKLASVIGPSAVPALVGAYEREDGGTVTERVTAILGGLGPAAIPRLATAIDDPRWHVQREVARILGRIGTAAAVPPLQMLLRRPDPRILQAAVSSLARIDDPAARRAVQTALKATAGEARTAVIDALVSLKDPRVVPMLTAIVEETDPFGADHPLIVEALGALATLKDDRAVPPIAALARKRRWLAWGMTGKTRAAALRTLVRIGSPRSRQALGELTTKGDFFLRRMAAAAAAGGGQ